MFLKVFRHPNFLDADACLRIRDAMDRGRVETADVLSETVEHQRDVRRASYVEVADDVLREVEARLDAQRADLAAFFRMPLTGREGAGFVRYPQGGFYRSHRDRAHVASWPDAARRRLATVVFLNDDFRGGVLRLLEGGGSDLMPAAGMLVAFPADVLHEVTPVRDGVRDAIVDWFY